MSLITLNALLNIGWHDFCRFYIRFYNYSVEAKSVFYWVSECLLLW